MDPESSQNDGVGFGLIGHQRHDTLADLGHDVLEQVQT